MPKVSIITINYNDGSGLEKTIQSVVSQTMVDYEFIIIDGNSTDDSIEIIKRYSDKINFWISEKDKGIYDAQNKGVSKANGDYLIFLNSGDSFYDNNVLAKFSEFEKNSHKKVIYGNSNVIDADGTSRILFPPQKLNLNFWYSNTLNHQAVFTNKSLFQKYGVFSTEYKFASDFEHLFKIFINEANEFAYINETICNFDNTGLTSKGEFHKLIIKERYYILKLHVSKSVYCAMRKAYLSSLSLKKRCIIIISENDFLRSLLKPVYLIYKKFA